MRVLCVSFLLAACHSAAAPVVEPPTAQEPSALEREGDPSALERGGEIDALVIVPGVRKVGETLEAYAVIEVEPDSRLQAAYRMAEATARAELIKVVQVHVSSYALDVMTDTEQTAETVHREAVMAAFATTQTVHVGWAKVQREGGVVMLVAARLVAPKSDVVEAVRRALPNSDIDSAALAVWARFAEPQ